jgi:hypothetical protein
MTANDHFTTVDNHSTTDIDHFTTADYHSTTNIGPLTILPLLLPIDHNTVLLTTRIITKSTNTCSSKFVVKYA